MRRLLIIAVIAVAAWFFFFRDVPQAETSTIAPPAPVPPSRQFETLLSSSPVDAGQLASLCSAYPRLGAKLLKGRQIQIKGTVADMRTSGMDGRRAEVILTNGAARKLVLVCDLDQYATMGVGLRYVGRFQVVGTELLYLAQLPLQTSTKRTVTTQGAAVTRPATLSKMGASWIEFKIVDGPSWAGALTNHG